MGGTGDGSGQAPPTAPGPTPALVSRISVRRAVGPVGVLLASARRLTRGSLLPAAL
jgi:hypothetical protein